MAIRTRAEMHIGLDAALEILDASPMNRLDPAIKDYFLNRTIAEFVKNVINKANEPDETKRVPFRILTHGDILNKYNDIYTLIKVDETLRPITPTDNNFHQYTLPSDMFRFEASYTRLRPIDCITYDAAPAPVVALAGSGAGNVDDGIHYYFMVYVYPTEETDVTVLNSATVTITAKGTNGKVAISSIPVRPTGCTAIKIYRTKAAEAWYLGRLLTTLSSDETTYTDNTADASLGAIYYNTHDTELPNLLLSTYDIIAFNNNPYGGKRKYIGTIIENNGAVTGYLKLYHLNRYSINRIGIIYIKKPAVLTSSPSPVNCDLPESVHDKIVDDTAKFISAATTSGNYEQLLMEAKQQN